MKKNFCLGLLMSCLITGNVGFAAEGLVVAYDKENPLNLNGELIEINGAVVDTKYGDINNYGQAGSTVGVLALQHGVANIGDDSTDKIIVDVKGQYVDGILADCYWDANKVGGKINLTADILDIKVEGTSSDGYVYGVRAMNRTTDADDNVVSKVEINAKDTYIKAVSDFDELKTNGIGAWSQGQVLINNGNVYIEADNVINTRGNSLVEINKNNNVNYTVQLNGDIVFKYNDPHSGTTIDSDVNINLSNSDSYLNGNITTNSDVNPIPDGKGNVDGMQLGLSNGAQWTTDADSFVNTLNFNGGIININGGKGHDVQLDKVNGTGGTVNIKAEIEEDKSVTSGKLNIGKDDVTDGTLNNLEVNFTGITADNFADKQKAADALNKLAGHVTVKENQNIENSTATIKEGIVSGAVSGDMTFTDDGTGSVDINNVHQNTSTSTMDNMRDVASVALVAWRQEDSTLSQRLGELRNSEGDQGIWARMSRGEFEYGGAFKNQYNYFQLGYDWAAGDWHYGAAVSHNDGQTTYVSGNGENDSTSLTLYGTWLGDKGQYTDIVVKQGKLNNEFTNYAEAGVTTGDYDMWGTSISAEYGQKLEMKNDWYVTPQAQLTYMRIGGEDYTAAVTKDGKSNPMQVSQDGMDSFVGRIGFEAGKNISEKGSIYAKASLLHEFAGEADTTLVYMGKPGTYSQDLGDTWYECGFGVNYKTSDNSYVYADIVKTFGGDVETPWQWNAGMRFTF